MFKRKSKRKVTKMQAVTVYKRKGQIIITPSSETTTGLWIQMGTSTVLEDSSTQTLIGQSVTDAFEHSRQALPHPEDWKSVRSPTLEAAGVGSWRTFARGSACCFVVRADGKVTFTPHRNLGTSGGDFEPLTTKTFNIADGALPKAIGEALLHALERCE